MANVKAITVEDLKEQVGVKGPLPVLFCTRCKGEFSANRGDYFMLQRDEELRHCNQPLRLMLKTIHMTEVEATDG